MRAAWIVFGSSPALRLGILTVVLAGSLCPAGVDGQSVSRILGRQVAWDVVLDGPEHEVSGIVLTETGVPREGASVAIDGVPGRVATDSEGRFSIRVPGPGEWVIRIIRPGAVPVEESLVVPLGGSVRMVVLMRERVLSLCALNVCNNGCRNLAIDVSDAETGLMPEGEVTVRVEHESGISAHTTQIDSTFLSGPKLFGLDREITTEGFHNIEVTAPGYQPWRLERVWLEPTDECHPRLVGGPREARLERIDP